jgi:hypothetical protein
MASVPRTDRIRRKLDWRHWPTNTTHDYGLIEPLREDSHHPELEDQSLLAWGLAQSNLSKDHSATVDVLYGFGDQLSTIREEVHVQPMR